MKKLIEQGLKNAMSYATYRKLVADLLVAKKSTGPNQTDDLFNYSKLGNARMKRLDKTFKLEKSTTESMQTFGKNITLMVLTEGWCGDAAHALPIINRMVELSDKVELKLVLRDENEALMDQFLTNGNRSIPKLVMLDSNTNEVLDTWGPRPSEATKMVREQKEKYGVLDADFKKELQVWYNNDKGINIEDDILKLLNTLVEHV